MKKAAICVIFLLSTILLQALDLTGIERWILNYPKGQASFAGYQITNCVIEAKGALLVFNKADTQIRLNVLAPIALNKLTERFQLIDDSVLDMSTLKTAQWEVKIAQCEIGFGYNDNITMALTVPSWLIFINSETTLDLKKKLADDPEFFFQTKTSKFLFTVRLSDIDPGQMARAEFPGWSAYLGSILAWFQNGLSANSGNVIGVVFDTKIVRPEKKEEEKRIAISRNERSNEWFGLSVDYRSSNFVSGERFGIYFNPFSYDTLLPMAYLKFKDIGPSDWQVKPYQLALMLGGYFEFNAAYWSRTAAGDYAGFVRSPGSFLFAYGPSAGLEFSAMVPRIVEGKHTEDLFGIGIELVTAVNIPYFFGSAYEYFWNNYIDFVIHLFPSPQFGLDVITGFNLAFATKNYDSAQGGMYLDKLGLSIGARLRFDAFNFYKSNELFR